jgi:SM-20-related protein
MTSADVSTWPDLFIVKDFLAPDVCREVVGALNVAQGDAATVYGRTTTGAVDRGIRQTLRLQPSEAIVQLTQTRLLDRQPVLEKHFGLKVFECEEPQFLRYGVGDFFVAHQDGNTGLLRLDTELRRISLIVFLSRESELEGPDTYCGGSLVFTDYRTDRKYSVPGEPGTLVAFRSEITHEVTPVTHGERYSIVSWFR